LILYQIEVEALDGVQFVEFIEDQLLGRVRLLRSIEGDFPSEQLEIPAGYAGIDSERNILPRLVIPASRREI